MLKKIRVVFQGKSEALMLSLTEQEMNEMDNLLNRMYTIAEVRNNWYNYSLNIENEIYCTKMLQVILFSVSAYFLKFIQILSKLCLSTKKDISYTLNELW